MSTTYFIALYVGLSCPRTMVKNYTDTWNNLDLVTLQKATKRCSFYFPRSPCLKVFIKVQDRWYRAVCGRAEK